MRCRCLLLVLPAMIVLSACSKNTSGTKAADICVDADGDGYGTGSVCSCAGGCNDCNDNDRTVFQLVAIYTDADHDTFGIGAGSKTCIGAQAPNGFSIRAGDCNDASAACTSDCTDADGDGTPACAGDCDDANPHCTETCVDADSDGYCGVKDCNDHSALHWDDCTTCVDFDGDGRGPGCDRGTTDCNDSDTDNWVSCATCADADGDGYFAHCDAYVTRKGEDCDDTDAVCTNDCSDFDHDGVRACDGDCDDGSADAACTINANGGNANQIVDAGGAGGSILVTAGSVRLLGGNDALPAALFTHGSVPSDPAALIVTTTHLISSSQTVAGLFVAKGATLTLSGAAPITLTVTDHVLITGAVVSDSGGSLTIVRSGSAAIVDVTLAGSVDLHGAAGASGHPGGTLIIAALHRCRHYDVGADAFATTYLEAADFETLYAELGFARESVRVEVVACPEWTEYGFESVLIAVGG